MARDTSFYYAFLILPAAQREAIIAVWDFCRAVDDAVDEPVGERDGRSHDDRVATTADLDRWRGEIDRCFANATPVTVQGRALQPFVRQFRLTRQPFDDLVDGVAMDLRHARYATFDELSRYCMRVASAVGLICVEIFGCRTASARNYAINLGLALQLTNILRDVGVDLARHRIYLPQEDLVRFGVSDEELAKGRVTESVHALFAFQASRAHHYFERAAGALASADMKSLTAAEIMGAIYRQLLTRIEQQNYDVFSQTIRVPRPRRAWIALHTWVRIQLMSKRDNTKINEDHEEKASG